MIGLGKKKEKSQKVTFQLCKNSSKHLTKTKPAFKYAFWNKYFRAMEPCIEFAKIYPSREGFGVMFQFGYRVENAK